MTKKTDCINYIPPTGKDCELCRIRNDWCVPCETCEQYESFTSWLDQKYKNIPSKEEKMIYEITFREVSVLKHCEAANSMEDAIYQFNEKANKGEIDFTHMNVIESQIIRTELLERRPQEPMGES